MRVLLLSAYEAGSHKYWQEQLFCLFPDWDWQLLSLPPRHFNWRVRGNALFWSHEERFTLQRQYDLLIATSMVDLSVLRGLVPSLGYIPSVLYFHENQFAYPLGEGPNNVLEPQMVSLYSSLCADRLIFNSAYNRDSFHQGLAALLKRLPDKVPVGIVDALQAKSTVIPVPIEVMPNTPADCGWSSVGEYPDRALHLLWVGRFEYDKGGELLLRIIEQLEATGLDYKLGIVGQQFRKQPAEFQAIEQRYAQRLVQFGYLASRQKYLDFLHGADIVLSTAGHEFQGLAVLEAVGAGAVPAVPDRLVYPEIFSSRFRYASQPEAPDTEAAAAVQLIQSHAVQLQQGSIAPPCIQRFTGASLHGSYEQAFLEASMTMQARR